MAQQYVGGGTSKLPTWKRTAPVAPRKPLASPNVNPSKNPSAPSYKAPAKPAPKPVKTAPKKQTAVVKKPMPSTNPASSYTVKSGDTLGAIAKQYGMSVSDIAKMNGIADPNRINVGQKIKVTAPKSTPAPTKVPMGKYADVYRDVHKNVPKSTPKAPVKQTPKAPTAPSAPAKPAPKVGKPVYQIPNFQTVKAPTNGTKPPASKPVTTPGKTPSGKDPETAASLSRLNKLWTQASGYKAEIDGLLKQGFNYNPETDPAYQSLLEMSNKQAQQASVNSMETMNDRGILNSTVTSDRIGQIEQGAKDQVTAAIPQLQQAAYGKHMDKVSNLYNLMNSVYADAERERGFGEDKRRWDLGYQQQQKEFETAKGQWEKEFGLAQRQQTFNETQSRIENTMREKGLELDHLQYQLSELNTMQKQNGYYDDKATQQALGSALKYQDAAGAAQWLSENSTQLYQNGADLSKIISALDKRFGGFQDAVTGGGGSLFP